MSEVYISGPGTGAVKGTLIRQITTALDDDELTMMFFVNLLTKTGKLIEESEDSRALMVLDFAFSLAVEIWEDMLDGMAESGPEGPKWLNVLQELMCRIGCYACKAINGNEGRKTTRDAS